MNQGMLSFIYLFHSNFPNRNRDSLIMGYFQLISLTEHSMSYAEDTRTFNVNQSFQLSSNATWGYVKQHVLNTFDIFVEIFFYNYMTIMTMLHKQKCSTVCKMEPLVHFCMCLVFRAGYKSMLKGKSLDVTLPRIKKKQKEEKPQCCQNNLLSNLDSVPYIKVVHFKMFKG